MAIVATESRSVRAGSSWQEALKTAIRDPAELCRVLSLPAEFEQAAAGAAESFPVFAPLSFVAKMQLGDVNDPLLKQVLPVTEELDEVAGFSADPVGDDAATRLPGLLRKYCGRALLVLTGACAIHCRYCFRRHFPYGESPRSIEQWEPAIAEIAADSTIKEILLSGGDPLMLVDSQLGELASRLAEIDHVRRLRIHTRLPVMIPQRVTDELIDWLRSTRLTPIFVIHANHPAELDEEVACAIIRLVDAGVPVLNQAVLLRGINDSVATLIELSQRLIDSRVMPYYLHQLDRVAGAAHFEVPVQRGIELVEELRGSLPGYAVPRYVQELPGAPGKRVLA